MSSETKRRYEKKARAASEEATRAKVIDAAIELHGTVGPARTTISAIAERAGVRRATVYRHFPDEHALLLGCSGTWAERNPLPDPASWTEIADPVERLAAALDALYAWYERVEPMLSKVLNDIDAVPAVAEVQSRRYAYLAAVEETLIWEETKRRRATLGLALDFYAWRTLHGRGLTRAEAVAVMVDAVSAPRSPG
jgi:AcrR family transcriptional regulator